MKDRPYPDSTRQPWALEARPLAQSRGHVTEGYFSIARAMFGLHVPDLVRIARRSRSEFRALRKAPRGSQDTLGGVFEASRSAASGVCAVPSSGTGIGLSGVPPRSPQRRGP